MPTKKTLVRPKYGPGRSLLRARPAINGSSAHSSSLTLSLKSMETCRWPRPATSWVSWRVLAKEAAPLGPAALLAVVHFLKRVTVLGAGEPEPLTGPWEQLSQGIVSVASLVLEEQLADAWLPVSEVRLAGLGEAGGPGLWFHPCLQLVV